MDRPKSVVRVIRGVASTIHVSRLFIGSSSGMYGIRYLRVFDTSQCLSALLGRPGRVNFILNGLRWKKKPNAPITPIRLLPGDSAPLGVINTAATRGGNGIHYRGGGGGPVRKDTFPIK